MRYTTSRLTALLFVALFGPTGPLVATTESVPSQLTLPQSITTEEVLVRPILNTPELAYAYWDGLLGALHQIAPLMVDRLDPNTVKAPFLPFRNGATIAWSRINHFSLGIVYPMAVAYFWGRMDAFNWAADLMGEP